VTALQTITERF